ncbi:MAG: hypothetical protein V8Q17_02230 [Acutalibacteraceae bacterium]
MDPSLMQRQGNTMLDTVTTMLKHVYPELFVTKESKKDTSDSSSQSDVPPQLIPLPVKRRQRHLLRIHQAHKVRLPSRTR